MKKKFVEAADNWLIYIINFQSHCVLRLCELLATVSYIQFISYRVSFSPIKIISLAGDVMVY